MGSKAYTVNSMQQLLQHVSVTFSQVSKVNWQGVQNFITNNSFEYIVKCIYAKDLVIYVDSSTEST